MMFALTPLQYIFGKKFITRRRITAGLTDERVKLTSEIIQGISSIKAFNWQVRTRFANSLASKLYRGGSLPTRSTLNGTVILGFQEVVVKGAKRGHIGRARTDRMFSHPSDGPSALEKSTIAVF